jgi:cation diffusion facilitator family transporter
MNEPVGLTHSHVFLGEHHRASERRTWSVIVLCAAMMAAEIVGGLLFGSIALVADGLHMATHAGALLLAALAYGYARRHASDPRFSFGTGKLGDLAGFTSAVVLAGIAVLIVVDAVTRLVTPVAIDFAEALPIAAVGLAVNVVSALLLGAGRHDHADHDRGHGDGPRRDNNMRAALTHVVADAAVSLLVILGLLLARGFGWLWMDPVVGLAGAAVILSWSWRLITDTAAILLDMTPDTQLASQIRAMLERDGDRVADLHLWRLGPGHLGAIVSVITPHPRGPEHYRDRLALFDSLSHVTVEVEHRFAERRSAA